MINRFCLLVCLAALAAFGDDGDSEVGVLITPPTWATTSAFTTVPRHYTPFGMVPTGSPVKLNTSAALGMCATLDGFAERLYVPAMTLDDPYRAAYDNFPPGPIGGWKTLDFNNVSWWVPGSLFWRSPAERQITNSWSRIFPRVSTMLETVRSKLRQLVRGDESYFVYDLTLSSSHFGGVDTLSFSWLSRDFAIHELSEVANGLCLDWSCTADWQYPRNLPINAASDILGLSDTETTNIYARIRPNSPAPLPSVFEIIDPILQEEGFWIRDGWLSNTWQQARIDANDFGWMNRLLLTIDKSYYNRTGLPIFNFEQQFTSSEVTLSSTITGGVFVLNYTPFDGPSAELESLDIANPDKSAITSPTNSQNDSSIQFDLYDLSAESSAYLYAIPAPLSVDASELALDLDVASDGVRPLIFLEYPDQIHGPIVEIVAAAEDIADVADFETNSVTWFTHSYFPVLDIIDTLPVASGKVSTVCNGSVQWTSRVLPYTRLGNDYSGRTNSVPHNYPIGRLVAPGYVKQINYQLAAKRSVLQDIYGNAVYYADDDSTNVEYYAAAVSTTEPGLDDAAFGMAGDVLRDCRRKASSAVNIDWKNPASSVEEWARHNSDTLYNDAITNANTRASWGVTTVGLAFLLKPINADVFGIYTVTVTNAVDGSTNAIDSSSNVVDSSYELVELPIIGDEFPRHVYGSVSAHANGASSTNAPRSSLNCELQSSAAIYWNFKNLPNFTTQ